MSLISVDMVSSNSYYLHWRSAWSSCTSSDFSRASELRSRSYMLYNWLSYTRFSSRHFRSVCYFTFSDSSL